jgi:hypothetical protein
VSATLARHRFGGEWTERDQPAYGLEFKKTFPDSLWDKHTPGIDAGWSRTDAGFGDGERLSAVALGGSYWRRTQAHGFNFLRLCAGVEVGTVSATRGGSVEHETYSGFYCGVGMNWGGHALELRGTLASNNTLHGLEFDPSRLQLLISVGGWTSD